MSLLGQAFPLSQPEDDDDGEKPGSQGADCVLLHTSPDTWDALFGCFGCILEEAKQTDPITLQRLSARIMHRSGDKQGVSKIPLSTENSCKETKLCLVCTKPLERSTGPWRQRHRHKGNKKITSF